MSHLWGLWPHQRYTERVRRRPESMTTRLRRLVSKAIDDRHPPRLPRILVVEDDKTARTALSVLFTRRGWDVVAVETVAEGIAGLNPEPDCLLLDLSLPDGDGEEVLAAVRSAGLATRVVIATGVDDPGRIRALKRFGFDSMLRKPMTIDQVARACQGPVNPGGPGQSPG